MPDTIQISFTFCFVLIYMYMLLVQVLVMWMQPFACMSYALYHTELLVKSLYFIRVLQMLQVLFMLSTRSTIQHIMLRDYSTFRRYLETDARGDLLADKYFFTWEREHTSFHHSDIQWCAQSSWMLWYRLQWSIHVFHLWPKPRLWSLAT